MDPEILGFFYESTWVNIQNWPQPRETRGNFTNHQGLLSICRPWGSRQVTIMIKVVQHVQQGLNSFRMGPARDRWDPQVQRQDALLSLLSDVFFTKLAAMSLLSPARARSFPSGLNLPGRRELKREWHRMFLTGDTCHMRTLVRPTKI